jgi:hypothetical protein
MFARGVAPPPQTTIFNRVLDIARRALDWSKRRFESNAQLSFVEFVFSGTGEKSALWRPNISGGSEGQVAKNRSSLANDV